MDKFDGGQDYELWKVKSTRCYVSKKVTQGLEKIKNKIK